jgi:hypothetical protein
MPVDVLSLVSPGLLADVPPAPQYIDAWQHFAHGILNVVAAIFFVFFGFRGVVKGKRPTGFGPIILIAAIIIVGSAIVAMIFAWFPSLAWHPSTATNSTHASAPAPAPAAFSHEAKLSKPSAPESAQADDSPTMKQVQGAVTSYMIPRASFPSSLKFLQWSDLRRFGSDLIVTVRYSATLKNGQNSTASVRFTVRDNTVVGARVINE